MYSGFCPARFGVLFCSVVLGCSCTHSTSGPCSQWCPCFNWCQLECNIAHLQSVAVLCMLYKIGCNPMHPLHGSLPLPYVPVGVTRGAVIAHRYTYPPPRRRTSQYLRIFVLLSVFLWNDLADPVFYGVGLTDFKSRANAFLLA